MGITAGSGCKGGLGTAPDDADDPVRLDERLVVMSRSLEDKSLYRSRSELSLKMFIPGTPPSPPRLWMVVRPVGSFIDRVLLTPVSKSTSSGKSGGGGGGGGGKRPELRRPRLELPGSDAPGAALSFSPTRGDAPDPDPTEVDETPLALVSCWPRF